MADDPWALMLQDEIDTRVRLRLRTGELEGTLVDVTYVANGTPLVLTVERDDDEGSVRIPWNAIEWIKT